MNKAKFSALGLAAVLAACGGGVDLGLGIGIGDEISDDLPPEVSLVASVAAAAPGSTVRLVAAAADDRGVARVQFWRVRTADDNELLVDDDSAPYEASVALPTDPGAALYFARAIDTLGQRRDSATVLVQVR